MYPAITVLEALHLEKDSILWVGGRDGMEEDLVTRREIPFKSIPAAGVHGVGLWKLPGNIWQLLKGVVESRRILRNFKPDVLFLTGGFVAFPMAVAAAGTPSLLYVPDIEPGLALKALSRFANKIALTTETSKAYFPNESKVTVTGYPVRPGLKAWSHQQALAYFNFRSTIPTLAIAGGSKGARSINMAVLDILPQLLEKMQVVHLTGHLDWEVVDEAAKKLPKDLSKRYQVFPYLHEMGAALAAADLILSRAGASILGEYPLFGLPAILVPYPYAWRYQKVNASYLADYGAAEILADEKLPEELYDRIVDLIFDHQTLSRMRKAMESLATSDAAKKIAMMVNDLAEPENGGMRS
ncbi:MAG: UDP-N-acetylglucosamine--N-acetylmuramyl-(pentapeptide) pyrophosphoryl-undecaprenol N-acetylglucosamine transferase [Chloroflexota bacterium]|nr:UDP-N-acetylglucosamine--N-acetylmuramyl-(pentapeptide) pyrophosphoryl-undecaprenol N-acetylglucosamine transferase [Chloroflexota bacterium]